MAEKVNHQPPYINIIDVPNHARLRPWTFPVTPIQIPKITNAGELEPETYQEPAWSLASSQPGQAPPGENKWEQKLPGEVGSNLSRQGAAGNRQAERQQLGTPKANRERL